MRTILRSAIFVIVILILQIVGAQVTQAATPTPVPISSTTPEASPTVTPSETPEATEAASVRVDISDTFISPYVISYTVITDTVPVVAPWRLAGESDVIDTYAAGDIIKSATTHDGYVAVRVGDASEGGQARYVWLSEESLEAEQTVMTETIVLAKILVNSLNVRFGPGTGYEVVDSMSLNSTAEILGEEDGWYRIPGDTSDYYISGAPQFVEVIEQVQEIKTTPNPVLAQYADADTESLVEICEQARELFPDATNIVVDPAAGPEAVDAEGNIVAQLFGSGWKTMEEVSVRRYSVDELLAEFTNNSEVINAIRRLPTELYAPDYEINSAQPIALTKGDYIFWYEDGVLWATVKNGDFEETLRWVEFSPRSNWEIPQFSGEHFDFYIDASYNSDNYYWGSLIKDEKVILLKVIPSTIDNITLSPVKKEYDINVGQYNIDEYAKYGYIGENEEMISDPSISGDQLIDNLVYEFKTVLIENCETYDGTNCYLENGNYVDLNKPIQFRLMRFPSIGADEGAYYLEGKVTGEPENPYKIANGQLFLDRMSHHPKAFGVGAGLATALSIFLQDEVGVKPDETNHEFYDYPIYHNLREEVIRVISHNGTISILNPLLLQAYGIDKSTGRWTLMYD